MNFWEEIKEAAKQLAGSIISVGATVFINSNGIPILFNYIGGVPEANIALQGLGVIVSYGIWKQAIIPIVENLYTKIMPQTTKVDYEVQIDYFAII